MPDERRVAEDLASFLADPDGLRLPEPLDVADAAQKALALHETGRRKGATFSPRFGDMRGQALYAVSIYPERSRKSIGSTVSPRILGLFIEDNEDLLRDPRCSVGLWYNADEDVTYRDITVTLPSREEAIELASKYDQIAIFDLSALTEIETGGGGDAPDDMPPAVKRLPSIAFQESQKKEQP